jgi:hypothetical protein
VVLRCRQAGRRQPGRPADGPRLNDGEGLGGDGRFRYLPAAILSIAFDHVAEQFDVADELDDVAVRDYPGQPF